MSITTALWVLTWLAILVLLFALAAVFREVRLLRGQVETLGWQPVTPTAPQDIQLPAAVAAGARRLVLVATSGCPLCQMFAHHLAEVAGRFQEQPVLLTYEGPDAWSHLPSGLHVVSDDVAWRQVAHLSPPVLLVLTPRGAVEHLAMPTTTTELDTTLAAWHLLAARTSQETS